MTTANWRLVGARLLGIYFTVIGAVTATGALMMAGVGLPEETDRRVIIAIPVVQAVVLVSAGLWLIRRSPVDVPEPQDLPTTVDQPFLHALRLLGIFFLVSRAGTLLGLALESSLVGIDWQFRASQLTDGAVEVLSGGALTFFTQSVAQRLQG